MPAAGPRGRVYQPHATQTGGPTSEFVEPADGYVSGEPWEAVAPLRYITDRAGSIYAGSNEIQRNCPGRTAVASVVITAFAATEPTSGPDHNDVATTARRGGDTWIINGAKVVISSAPIADHLLVTARTDSAQCDDSGISLFLVEFDAAHPPRRTRGAQRVRAPDH